MIDEQKNWRLIESFNWKSDHDYERIWLEVSTLGEDTINELEGFLGKKVNELREAYQDVWLGNDGGPGLNCADDGWCDLLCEIVGRGEDFYNSLTVEKLRKMDKDHDYAESFHYCFFA